MRSERVRGTDDELGRASPDGEARLRLALIASGLGTFRIDILKSEVHYSPELAAMLGFPGVTVARIEGAFTRVHRDDQERVRREFEALLDPQGEGRLSTELRYVRPGGQVRWMTWNGVVEFDGPPGHRRAARIFGACADTTERKEAEVRLRNSEARFRSLLELSSDWYWEQDENLRFVEFSDSVARLAGSSAPSHLGKTRWELPTIGVTEEMWARHRAQLERREPFRDFEFQRINERGELIWLSTSGDPVFDEKGRFRGYRGVGHNITSRRRTEARLKESEARFRLLADSAPVLIWVTSSNGSTGYFNRPYLTFVGVGSEAEIANGGWRRYVHPDDHDEYIARFRAAVEQRRQFEGQCRLRRADGEYRWMKSIGLPRFAADGHFIGYVGSMLDITDLKENEERIALLARELDHRVKNILSRFEAVISRTGDAPLSTEEFVSALRARISAMSRAHGLLSRASWSGVPIDALISDELGAYATARNVAIAGEALMLTPGAAQALSMVVNELATNAAKYGALSVAEGRVSVTWRRVPQSSRGECLRIEWREMDGPAPRAPVREGFGTSVIRGLLAHEYNAEVQFDIGAGGASCDIMLPVAGVLTGR